MQRMTPEGVAEALAIAKQKADLVRVEFGDDDFRTVFKFDLLFDKIRDKEATRLLEDITLARNSAIEGGFARVMQLFADPQIVLDDLGVADRRTITISDVNEAITSGTLRAYFDSQADYANHLANHMNSGIVGRTR